MSITTDFVTAEDLLQQYGDARVELVRGELVEMSPASLLHGQVAAVLHAELAVYLREHPIGKTFIAEAGFLLQRNPDTVRVPDIAYISNDDLPVGQNTGFSEGAPTLAVEVISPNDRMTDVMNKAGLYLRTGGREVWLVDPQRRQATVCSLDDDHLETRDVDVLSSEDLLPGFALTVSGLWPSE